MEPGDVIRPVLAVTHVVAAMLYVTGYVSTGTLTSMARKAPDLESRRRLLDLSGRFDFLFQIPFGTLVALSGIALFMATGHTLAERWLIASIVLYAVVVFIGAGIWRRFSMSVRDAVEAGDDARLLALLGDPRAEALRWVERILVATVVVLMVLRPV